MASPHTYAALLAVVWLVGWATGCGYTSTYVPPADGRVRPVWLESDVAVQRSGLSPSEVCSEQAFRLIETPQRAPGGRVLVVSPAGFWLPRYYGGPIVAVGAGLVPHLSSPRLFVPRQRLDKVIDPASTPDGKRLRARASQQLLAAILAVEIVPEAAPLTLLGVDLWLALGDPESSASARAIDEVNALNDLVRSPGSPCDAGGAS